MHARICESIKNTSSLTSLLDVVFSLSIGTAAKTLFFKLLMMFQVNHIRALRAGRISRSCCHATMV